MGKYRYGKHDMDCRKPDFEPPCDMDDRKYDCEPPCDMETIVKCGMGMSPGPLCRDNNVAAGGANSVPGGGYQRQCPVIASVVLDTRKLKNSTVKIDFSSLISFKTCAYIAGGYNLRLVFKLNRICQGGHPVTLGTWTFEKAAEIPYQANGFTATETNGGFRVQETESFGFTWCECGACPGCCTYQVQLVEQECYNIDFACINNIFITGTVSGCKKY